jgi:hypothetical protein
VCDCELRTPNSEIADEIGQGMAGLWKEIMGRKKSEVNPQLYFDVMRLEKESGGQ